MRIFTVISILIGFSHLMALGQDQLLSPEELKRQLEERLEQLSDIDTFLYDTTDPEWITDWQQQNELSVEGMPQVLIVPEVLDQNRMLLQKLDWATHNMPIKDFPADTIRQRDP
ncbi:MAG: hypothetical protein ACR2MX_07600 [Cyclobacteriaceae bacterium]